MEITVIVAAAAVSLGLVGLLWAIAGERSAPSARQLGGETTDLRTIELRRGFGNRAMAPLIRWLSIRARRFTPIGLVESLDRKISLAGLRERLSLERALALKFIITSVGAAFGLYDLLNERPFRGIAVMALGYFAIDIILWSRARERQAEIQKALPDTMDQLRISVEAGLAFDAAVDRVSRGSGPLAREFALVGSDIQLGASRNEAFKNLINRTDVPGSPKVRGSGHPRRGVRRLDLTGAHRPIRRPQGQTQDSGAGEGTAHPDPHHLPDAGLHLPDDLRGPARSGRDEDLRHPAQLLSFRARGTGILHRPGEVAERPKAFAC